MAKIDLVQRGRLADKLLEFILGTLAGSPVISFLLGVDDETQTARPVRVDTQGRLLISGSTQQFSIINSALPDVMTEFVSGGSLYRKITFYAKDANALLEFRLSDGSVTASISVVPNVPLIIEGTFDAALARNETIGVISTLQAVVNSNPLR